MKEKLKQEFSKNGCLPLWKEIWDKEWFTYNMIVDECMRMAISLWKICEMAGEQELSGNERRFLSMVNEWE